MSLIKLILTFLLLGLIVYEAGAPIVTQFQLDGIAAESARQGLRDFDKSNSQPSAKKAAEKEAEESGATVISFDIGEERGEDQVRLTVYRRAPSLVLRRWDKTSGYYDVTVEGSARGGL